MRNEPEGPGWWMASDGKWYPPELHPAVLSGDKTVEEMRGEPLAQHHRTAIRWVAERDDATATERAGEGAGRVATAPGPGVAAPDQAGEAPAVDAAPAAAAPVGAPTTPHEATPPEATPEPPQEPSPAEEAKESPSWGPPASPLAHAAPEAASLSLGPPPEAPEAPTETPEGVAEDQAIRDAFTKGAATRRERGRTPRVRASTTATGDHDAYELPPERPSRLLLLGVAVAAIALIAISAFTFIRNRDDDGDGVSSTGPNGPIATGLPDGATVSTADELEPGVCLSSPDLGNGDLRSMSIVDCDEPHTHEVYHRVEYEPASDEFDLDGVQAFATETCRDAFEAFVGIPYARSRYSLLALGPTRDGWSDGDRTVVCLVYDRQELVTGSLEGAEA